VRIVKNLLKQINYIPLFLILLINIPIYAQENSKKDINRLIDQINRIERQRQKEAEEFRRVIEQMEKRDKERQEDIEALKEMVKELEVAIPTKEEKEQTESMVEVVKSKLEPLTEKLKVYGDLRLRSEIDANREDRDDPRFRERIRFRLGAEYKIYEDQLIVGARLRTGDSSDPRSPYVNLENDFENFEFSLDRVYLKYNPSFYKSLTFYGGKFGLPFKTKAVYNELVWDQDVQPEGFAAIYNSKYNGVIDEAYLTVGEYFIDRLEDDYTWATYAQVLITKSFENDWKLRLAAGTYLYTDFTSGGLGTASLVRPPKNRGNAVKDTDGDGLPDEFLSDFYILDTFMDLEYSGFDKPIILTGEYFHNFGAEIDEDNGFAVGAQVGKASKPRDWKIYYQFQLVERDSVFTPFSQDDFLLATNFWGHVAGIAYRITDRVDVHLWTLISKRDKTFGDLSDENQVRTRLDLNVKF